MSSDSNYERLLQAVYDRNFDAVKVTLEAGADVDGPKDAPFAPIAAAAWANDAGMVEYLLGKGADPNRPFKKQNKPGPRTFADTLIHGERPLHITGGNGNVEVVRLLLKQSRADPNATDSEGHTPLMTACTSSIASLEIVRLLLEAGADPALADGTGMIALHLAAEMGHTGLVDIMYSSEPDTLNRPTFDGMTMLYVACESGHENMVSQLLSLEAMKPAVVDQTNACPLAVAVKNGFVGVVRVLINEVGIRMVGGRRALPRALAVAVCSRQVIILRLLLAAEGDERRSEWANTSVDGQTILHYAACVCYPAAVSTLLGAGADEAACDSRGRIPLDAIGQSFGFETSTEREKEVATNRMLQRGPAYRARSWVCSCAEEPDACGSVDSETVAATTVAGDPSSLAAESLPPVIGVQVFRAKKGRSSESFGSLIGR